MASLRAYQDELKKLLFFHEQEPTDSVLWGKTIPERLDVYRNNTRSNWTEALDCDFPLTKKQFSEEEWETLRARYFTKHPPRHWELNTSMTPFWGFLAKQKVPLFVKELADYEWHDLKVFIDRSAVRPGVGITNPTVVIRVFQHQIFDWVEADTPKTKPPQQKPEVLLFYRDSKNTTHIQEADPLMILLAQHFSKTGARLEALETVRQRLLPQNKVSLESVYQTLKKQEIIL